MWTGGFGLKEERIEILGSHLYACVEAAKLLNICMAPPYVLNPFHPKLPLSLLSPVSLPLVYPPRSFLSLTRCLLTSCAQMAERKRRDGFIWRVRALKHQGHAHTHGGMAERLAAAGIRGFCPRI